MSGYDANFVYAVPVLPPDPSAASGPSGGLSLAVIRDLLQSFIMEFRVGGRYTYRCVHRLIDAFSDPLTSFADT